MIEKQELHCHNCDKYVQFDLDMELDGYHVLTCPSCGHEHCRVVRNGKITGDRWDQRNGLPTIYINSSTTSVTNNSTYTTYYGGTGGTGTGGSYYYMSWMNATVY